MPELPEVEVIRGGLEPLLKGKRLQAVHCFRADLRYPLPDFTRLSGCWLYKIERRSKYLLFYWQDAEQARTWVMTWHLGMTGQFHVLDGAIEAGSHEHVRFDFEGGKSLRYRDARRFGYAAIFPEEHWQEAAWFCTLGPEPLSDAFTLEDLAGKCAGRKVPIKSRIMDAHVVVGVGNIYASESLFKAGIHPARMAGKIGKKRLEQLRLAIRETLQQAIAAGGSSISDFVQVDGKLGYFAHCFSVYGREGESCLRCDGTIRRMVQSGRSTFYCPSCQH